jgi:predicted ester cyclase
MQWGDDTVLTAVVSSSPSRGADVARRRGLMLDFFSKLDVGDLSAFDLFGPGFVHHNRLPGAANDSRDEARRAFGTFHQFAPDMRHDVQDIVVEGELVALRVIHSGTLQREVPGFDLPTGPFQRTLWMLYRFQGNAITEEWLARTAGPGAPIAQPR